MTSRRALLRRAGGVLAAGSLASLSMPLSSGPFRFDASVGTETRAACRRVASRFDRVAPETPHRQVRVATVEPEALSGLPAATPGPLGPVLDAARHLDSLEHPADLRTSGVYRPQERTIVLARGRIDEPLIAHELTHVLQRDRVGRARAPASTRDGSAVASAITEGTAYYVQALYQRACRDGRFDGCATSGETVLDLEATPALLALGGIERVAGLELVRRVRDRRGWSGVWELHRSPPASLADVLFPERYFSGAPAPEPVAVPEHETREWLRIDEATLGVGPLYAKLVALGAADLWAPAPDDSEPLLDAAGLEGLLRSPLLSAWRGDRIAGWGRVADPDRIAYAWRTRWASAQSATDVADAVATAYEERGDVDGAGWQIDGDYHAIARDGATVTFTAAPNRDEHAALFDGDRGASGES